MIEKRDQRAYDIVQKYRFTIVLFVVVRIAGMLDAPCRLKPSMSGPHGYSPRAMAVIVFYDGGDTPDVLYHGRTPER